MKKVLLFALTCASVLQLGAYDIRIKNDTDDTTFRVKFAFEKIEGERRRREHFTLSPGEEREIKDLSDNLVLTDKGIHVHGTEGRGRGQREHFVDFEPGKSIDIELKVDNAGRIVFDEELRGKIKNVFE